MGFIYAKVRKATGLAEGFPACDRRHLICHGRVFCRLEGLQAASEHHPKAEFSRRASTTARAERSQFEWTPASRNRPKSRAAKCGTENRLTARSHWDSVKSDVVLRTFASGNPMLPLPAFTVAVPLPALMVAPVPISVIRLLPLPDVMTALVWLSSSTWLPSPNPIGVVTVVVVLMVPTMVMSLPGPAAIVPRLM